MSSLFAKCRNIPWLVFALVCAWKVALLALSAQPVPANDAYFYDGAVVNKLLHGGYYNPTIALALPISGTRFFSAYPPVYQVVLWAWMSLFGTSALSAMALHLFLFVCYAVVVFKILQRLQTPVWCFHFAGLYLLLLTFHDRPDSLAHLLGMLAVLALICSRSSFHGGNPVPHPGRCLWSMVVLVVLTLFTSLQIGGIYFLWIWFGMVATTLAGRERFPALAMAATVAVPLGLAVLVRFVFPGLWAGFWEHAGQTPSYTGWRMPDIYELLKVARTAPGIFLILILLPWSWFKQHNDVAHLQYARQEFLLLPALVAAMGVVGACLFVLTANTVGIANYMQPVIVATYLAMCATLFPSGRWLHTQILCLSLGALLGSIRAVGMSTWGLACAADVGYPTAVHRVEQELTSLPPGSKVVMSSAFLYGAAKHREVTLIHSDWMARAKSGTSDLDALLALKPGRIILTQFDYYRRYQSLLEHAGQDPSLVQIQITNTATLPPPDSFKPLQRVVQHVSWAPIIVQLSWRDGQ